MTKRPLRLLVSKAGLDGHDRGIKIVARALRDAGMEVIYTGLRQSVRAIAMSAVQEDVDAVALSILSGAHMSIFSKLRKALDHSGLKSVLLTGGGIIPPEDQKRLSKLGVGRTFGPGTATSEVVKYIASHA